MLDRSRVEGTRGKRQAQNNLSSPRPTVPPTKEMTAMVKEKTHINIMVTGHVDSGKFTTTGHLITNVEAWTREPLRSLRRGQQK